jgi:hypothetical protein
MDLIYLAQDRNKQRAVTNKKLKQNAVNFLMKPHELLKKDCDAWSQLFS